MTLAQVGLTRGVCSSQLDNAHNAPQVLIYFLHIKLQNLTNPISIFTRHDCSVPVFVSTGVVVSYSGQLLKQSLGSFGQERVNLPQNVDQLYHPLEIPVDPLASVSCPFFLSHELGYGYRRVFRFHHLVRCESAVDTAEMDLKVNFSCWTWCKNDSKILFSGG